MTLVCFSHGKESGPNGTKIQLLSQIARAKGFDVISIDYRGMDDPNQRIKKLLTTLQPKTHQDIVLVGSSMGGYVSIHGAEKLKPKGLFLMAPAVYMPGYTEIGQIPQVTKTLIYHGWQDDIVPPENAISLAKTIQCQLMVVDDDHPLSQTQSLLAKTFEEFLNNI